MSELKEYEVRIGRKLYQTLPPIVYVVADDNQPKLLNDKVYLKSEADKVIAEKDKEIALLKERICNGDVSRLTWIDDCIAKDKEIVGLKDKLQKVSELLKETREWLIESQKMHKRCADNAIKQLRHHKHKLCLAMAYKCVKLCQKYKDRYRWAEDENLEHYYNHKIEFFARWHNRWLELAEKFKEAK